MTTLTLTRQYIEQRNGGYYITDTRISLDSIVYAFLNGESSESIAQNFPLLTLEQVYGAIAFYLANQATIDTYLAQEEIASQIPPQKKPLLYQRLKTAQIQQQDQVLPNSLPDRCRPMPNDRLWWPPPPNQH